MHFLVGGKCYSLANAILKEQNIYFLPLTLSFRLENSEDQEEILYQQRAENNNLSSHSPVSFDSSAFGGCSGSDMWLCHKPFGTAHQEERNTDLEGCPSENIWALLPAFGYLFAGRWRVLTLPFCNKREIRSDAFLVIVWDSGEGGILPLSWLSGQCWSFIVFFLNPDTR